METIMQTWRDELATAARINDTGMVRAIAGEVAREAVKRYAPHRQWLEATAKRQPGALAVRWLSGSPAHETNDCSVRALSNVSALSYEEAHALVADKCGRVNRKGPQCGPYRDLLDSLATRVEGSFRTWDHALTFAAFVRTHPRGVFLVWVTGHALALVDGKVIDSHVTPPRKRVEGAWKFAD